MNARARWQALAGSSLPPLALLYLALFGAFGMESPFFPSFLASRHLGAREIAAVLAIGTVVRIAIGPLFGLLADRVGVRAVLAGAAAGAGTLILLYLPAAGLPALMLVGCLHSLSVTPLNPLCDTLAVEACRREALYPYGWVRGIGSAGFVAATLASGALVRHAGLASSLIAAACLFLFMLPALPFAPAVARHRERATWRDAVGLLRNSAFVRMLLVAALVIGSHVMSNTFAVIHWRAQRLGAETIAILWAEAIFSEIAVFVFIGPTLLRRFGIARCAMLAATAGALRWGIFASTTQLAVLAVAQASQGLTYALTHLACMAFIADAVRPRLAATAQALYGTLALGGSAAILTLASGEAYGLYGAAAFWLMAALCIVALPVARSMSSE